MTTVNWEKNDGLESIKCAGNSSTNLALTASLSSCRKEHIDLALGCPKHPSSTVCKFKVPEYEFHQFHRDEFTRAGGYHIAKKLHRKLFPRSDASTLEPSTTVTLPIPPSTRFFNASVPVGPQLSKHMLAFSSAAWP
jgi:hypothetical protein